MEATEANNLSWAMAQDNDFETWRSYSNRFWPAKYLIDKKAWCATPTSAKADTPKQKA